MLFQNNLNQKQLEKYSLDLSLKPVPVDWNEFASLCDIRSGGTIRKFDPFYYQSRTIELLTKPIQNPLKPKSDPIKVSQAIILKSRQLGYTETWLCKALHDACLHEGASSHLYLRNGDDASSSSRRFRLMLNSLYEYVRPQNDNVTYAKIRNGGEVYFKNSSSEGSRGASSSTLQVYDEAGFNDSIGRIFSASAASGALSESTQLLESEEIKESDLGCIKIIQSTPSTKNGFFWEQLNQNNPPGLDIEELALKVVDHEIYSDNLPGWYWFVDEAGVLKIICHWSANPVYAAIPNFLDTRKKADLADDETISREYELRFLDSSRSVFDPLTVRECVVDDIEVNSHFERIAGLDCSTMGDDFTCFPIFELEPDGTCKLIHEYRKRKVSSDEHLYRITELTMQFKVRKICLEVSGGVGQVYLEQLELAFAKLNYECELIPIKTTGDSKPKMVQSLAIALQRKKLIFSKASALIDELLNFRQEGNKYSAVSGKHDDLLMACCFVTWLLAQAEEQQRRDKERFNSLNTIEQAHEMSRMLGD